MYFEMLAFLSSRACSGSVRVSLGCILCFWVRGIPYWYAYMPRPFFNSSKKIIRSTWVETWRSGRGTLVSCRSGVLPRALRALKNFEIAAVMADSNSNFPHDRQLWAQSDIVALPASAMEICRTTWQLRTVHIKPN
jgi:hypothetical protein